MIFVTVGTEKFPFDRLIKTIDDAVRRKAILQEVFSQIGSCRYQPVMFSYKKFVDFEEMAKNILGAELVVCHAGVGSTILSLTLGKIPIIFPRRHNLGEHLDDHQLEFAKRMEATGKVIVAYDESQLIQKINNYQSILAGLKPTLESSKNKLVAYLREVCSH